MIRISYSGLWREVRAALGTHNLHHWFDLDPAVRALIVAAYEQREKIDRWSSLK